MYRGREDPAGLITFKDEGNVHETTRIIAIAMLIGTTGLVLNVTQALQVGGRRLDLQRHDLSVTGCEVVQAIVELAPGTTAPRHTHPGEEIIYVLEGTWEYTVEGKPPVILKSGGVLFIPAGRSIRREMSAPTGQRSSRRISSRKGSRSSRWWSDRATKVQWPREPIPFSSICRQAGELAGHGSGQRILRHSQAVGGDQQELEAG